MGGRIEGHNRDQAAFETSARGQFRRRGVNDQIHDLYYSILKFMETVAVTLILPRAMVPSLAPLSPDW